MIKKKIKEEKIYVLELLKILYLKILKITDIKKIQTKNVLQFNY